MAEVVANNTRALQPPKLDESGFLDMCSAEDREYFAALFGCLKASDVEFTMGTKSFSIKDRRRKSAKGILLVFPTGDFQVITSLLSPENLRGVKEFLDSRGSGIDADKKPPATIRFGTSQLPLAGACEFISLLLKKKVVGPEALPVG